MSLADVPMTFGRFLPSQPAGQEGATTFHEAMDPESGGKVLLITFPAGADTAEDDRFAFRLPRMRHPNCVPVLDAGRTGGLLFVAAEWRETESLSTFLARAGRIPVFHGLALVLELLSAIGHAQARRLVHAGIDLEHLQVTRTGVLRLPAAGWSLSTDRQPNLEAAARVAQVLLSGTCAQRLRDAIDAVLLRAQGRTGEPRYADAEAFALALLAATGHPVASRSPAVPARAEAPLADPVRIEPVLVQPDRDDPVLADLILHEPLRAEPVREVAAPPRGHSALSRRGHAVRNALAACLLAVLVLPAFVGHGTLPRGEPAHRPAAPTPPPMAAVAVAAPVVAAPVQAPVAASTREEPARAAPRAAPRPAARAPRPVATRSGTRRAAARPAVRQRTTQAMGAPAAPRPRTGPQPQHATVARTGIPIRATAYGCPSSDPLARYICEVQQCSRPELRDQPMCARMAATQRAALARLRGTPD